MSRLSGFVMAVLLVSVAAIAQPTPQKRTGNNQQAATSTELPSMPSEAEIGELVNKATEYIETYRRTFKNAKPSLDKDATPGFDQSATTLADQAIGVIAGIKKNGPTAVALVSLLTILYDMRLNAQKASAAVMLVAMREDRADQSNHGMQDFQDLAQVGKNCYDISELLFHSTIRYISAEEAALRVLLHKKSQ